MAVSTIQIRVDDETRAAAADLFEDLGLDLETAVRIFLKKSLSVGGIPFNVRFDTPNKETVAAMVNTLNGENLSRAYDSVEELFADLNAEADGEDNDAEGSV